MTPSIDTLRPVEPVTFDHATLADFCTAQGAGAEAAVAAVLAEIEALIWLAATQGDHLAGLTRSCDALVRIGTRIGMTTITGAAGAILDCISTGDDTGRAACTARLIRLGEPRPSQRWAVQATPDTAS